MPTDDERRAVARRLRACKSHVDSTGWFWLNDGLYGVHVLSSSEERLRRGMALLADLIEPSCDRDALLRLARYMDKDVAETEAHFSNVISTKSVSDYARRIREALGVVA